MPMDPLTTLENLQIIILAALVAATLALALKQARDLRAMERRLALKRRYVTLIDCGGKIKKREFREGDYVGARLGECEGSEGLVVAIYVEEPKTGERREVKSPRTPGSISRGV